MRRLTDDELEIACRASWAVARFHISAKLASGDPGPWNEQSAQIQEVTRLELRAAFAAVEQSRAALQPTPTTEDKGREDRA